MSFAPGTRLGSYEILSPLGAGGMGEVFPMTGNATELAVLNRVGDVLRLFSLIDRPPFIRKKKNMGSLP